MSKYRLIEEELGYLHHYNHSFFNKLIWKLTKKEEIEYEVTLSSSVFLRLKVFCEDIEDLGEIKFTIEDLVHALYKDFLFFAKKVADLDKIYTQLTIKHQLLDGPNHNIESEQNHHQERIIYKGNQIVATQDKGTSSYITIRIGIQRKEALRGEVVLADMEEKYPEHPFSIDLILTILIYDFIGEVKAGNAKILIEQILKTLEQN